MRNKVMTLAVLASVLGVMENTAGYGKDAVKEVGNMSKCAPWGKVKELVQDKQKTVLAKNKKHEYKLDIVEIAGVCLRGKECQSKLQQILDKKDITLTMIVQVLDLCEYHWNSGTNRGQVRLERLDSPT